MSSFPCSFQNQHKAAAKGRQPSLGKVIFRIYGMKMAWAGVMKLTSDFAGLVGPLCVSGIVLYVSDTFYKTDTGSREVKWL